MDAPAPGEELTARIAAGSPDVTATVTGTPDEVTVSYVRNGREHFRRTYRRDDVQLGVELARLTANDDGGAG